jgi:HEAT repeat protein
MRIAAGASLALAIAWASGCAEPAQPAGAGTGISAPPAGRGRAAPPSALPDDPLELARRLVDGSIAPEAVPAERAAEVAVHVLSVGQETAEDDLLRRLDVLRRLGPAASSEIEDVVACGGLNDVTTIAARATLEAIDPERTLRIEPFLREAAVEQKHGMNPDWGLWSAGPAVVPRLVEVLGVTEGESWRTALDAAEVLAEFGPDAAAAIPALRAAMHDTERGSRLRDAATEAVLRVSEGREPPLEEAVPWIVAREDLRELVVAARPFLDAELAGLLTHETNEVRAAAARLLAERAPETPGIAEALAAGLTLEDRDDAADCRRALVAMGPRAAPTIPALVALLDHPGVSERGRAIEVLGSVGDRETALPALRAALADPENGVLRDDLGRALVLYGPEQAGVLLPVLAAALAEEHTLGRRGGFRTVRGWWWAAERLGDLGAAAAPQIAALIDALDEGSGADDHASAALVKLGGPAVEPLAAAVAERAREERRIGAAATLGRMGPTARGALGALRGAFTDPSPQVRVAAAFAVVRIEPPATDAPAVLAAALVDQRTPRDPAAEREPQVPTYRWYYDRQRLWESLGALGPAHHAALPAVRAAQSDPDGSIRVTACEAERRITGDATALVAECVRQIESRLHPSSALDALAGAGPEARNALPALERLLRDQPARVFEAKEALAAADPGGRVFVASLAQLVATGTDSEVERACEALAKLGPAAAPVVPALVAKLERICTWPQQTVVEALGAIGPAAAPAVPQIRLRLDEFYAETRAAAREALRRIDPEGRAADVRSSASAEAR